MLGPIRAALTSQDLSYDTKFGPSQSRKTLPLNNEKYETGRFKCYDSQQVKTIFPV